MRKIMSEDALTPTDITLLTLLQQDARTTNQALAEAVNLSPSPCWRKVKKLEEDKVILGYHAALDRRKIGLGVMVFVRVSIDSHSEAQARRFEQEVMELENVVACYSIGGDADFLLQVVSRDLENMQFDTSLHKCTIVVDRALTPGLAMNAASVLGVCLGRQVEGLVGPDLLSLDGVFL